MFEIKALGSPVIVRRMSSAMKDGVKACSSSAERRTNGCGAGGRLGNGICRNLSSTSCAVDERSSFACDIAFVTFPVDKGSTQRERERDRWTRVKENSDESGRQKKNFNSMTDRE
jgi:hypothetical protein